MVFRTQNHTQSKVGIVVRVDPCFERNRKTASKIENIPSGVCAVWNGKTIYGNIVKRGNDFFYRIQGFMYIDHAHFMLYFNETRRFEVYLLAPTIPK